MSNNNNNENLENNVNSENVNEKEKKKLSPRKIFWTRFSLWTIFAAILPFCFIAWRFELFKSPGSTISVGGWGFLAVIIVSVFIIVVTRYVNQGMKFSMISQCLNGFVKVILPLTVLLVIVFCMQNSVKQFIQALGCAILCECVAIPINPLPKWINDNKKKEMNENFDNFADKLADKFGKK